MGIPARSSLALPVLVFVLCSRRTARGSHPLGHFQRAWGAMSGERRVLPGWAGGQEREAGEVGPPEATGPSPPAEGESSPGSGVEVLG